MRRSLAVALVLAACLPFQPAARAQEARLLLEVVVNGRSTGRQVEFIQRDGRLFAAASDLRDAGLQADGLGPDPVPLDALPGLRAQIEERTQVLRLQTPDAALVANEVSAGNTPAPGPVTPAEYGAALNYDLLGTQANGRGAASAVLDGRISTPWVTGTAGWLVQGGLPTLALKRLDTAVTRVDPDTTRRWQAGDLIAGGLGWTRPFRLGGVQLASDFGTRPDLVTYPVPLIGGRADVPSTVDLFVNNVRQLSQPVDQGPFQVRQPPLLTGAGDVAVVVRDVTGRETVQSLTFYASPTLLREGLAAFSVEGGWVRKDYAMGTDRYAEAAVSGTGRYGATNWLTAEIHAEATSQVAMGGVGAAVNLGNIAIASGSLAVSNPNRPAGGGRRSAAGSLGSVGIERNGRWFSVAASTTIATSAFQDVATTRVNRVPTTVTRISVGASLGEWGSLRAAYAEIQGRPAVLASATPDRLGNFYGQPVAGNARILSITYNRPLTPSVQLFANAYRNFSGGTGATGVVIGLVVPLGSRTALTASGGLSASRGTSSVEAGQSAVEIGDVGWMARLAKDPTTRQTAQASYVAPFGTGTAEVDRVSNNTGLRVGATGALVAGSGGVFASNRINDSYAVVDTGGVPGVGVLQENRPVGRTDSAGKLLVPNLSGFQANRLSLNPFDLPADAQADTLRREVRPPARSQVNVGFGVRRGGSALLRLVFSGAPVPAGSVVTTGAGKQTPVGFDGEVFLSDLSPRNRLEVRMARGACLVEFDFEPKAGTVPTLGPLPCTAWSPP